jgi:hypothetical protein
MNKLNDKQEQIYEENNPLKSVCLWLVRDDFAAPGIAACIVMQ